MSYQDWYLIDSTLREGEQFAPSHFFLVDKVEIAEALDAFGAEYLELTTPVASPESRRALETIAGLGLNAKILTHTRANLIDACLAADCGVDGVDILFGTSSALRTFSHGREVDEIIDESLGVIHFVKSRGLNVRFSSEDTFRSDKGDLLRVYAAADRAGVDRVGLADTVGGATPTQVRELIADVRPGDLLVGGRNWGLGSSREYAPQALKILGVGAIIAKSFARIHYRNLLNLGIPAFTSETVPDALENGDTVTFDLTAGTLTRGGVVFRLEPAPEEEEDWGE